MVLIKKEYIITIICISFIFLLGFLIRLDSVNLYDSNNKDFYQDSAKLPYFFELDSYYHYRLAKNFITHGYLGDKKVDGIEWDLHSYYPPGVPMDYPPLIIYLSAFIYYLINLFAEIPLLTVVFWIPAFIAPLSGVVAYFLVKRFTNNFGAVAAGIFIVTAPMFTLRTVVGWFDTDIFIIFFPLLLTLFFFLAVQNKNNFKKRLFFSILLAISMFLYSLAWTGWQYTFYFITIFSAMYLIWCKFKGYEVKKFLSIYLIFALGSLLLIGILYGLINVYNLFTGPLELVDLSKNPWVPWPDVYATVSELSIPTITEIISSIGLAFFAGIFGYVWLFRIMINQGLKKSFIPNMNWFYYFYLLSWSVLGVFTLIKGVRFVMLLIPPMCISAGIFIGISIEYLRKLTKNKRFDIFNRKKYLINMVSILILVWITIPAVLSVHESIATLQPMVNDDMWSVTEWIHNYTPNDSVIISQWSYGHFFTAIADRPVNFDDRLGYIETIPSRNYGDAYPYKKSSPGIYREYWFDKALTTSNETLSAGIFRMLATSGDLAYLSLNNFTKNTSMSVEIMNNILGVNKSTANQILINNYHLKQEEANIVLEYTHPGNPRPYVLITSIGFLGIGDDIFEFGEWNFNANKGSDFVYSYQKFNIYNESLITANDLNIDLNNSAVTWNNKTPYKLIIITGNLTEERIINQDGNFSVFLLMDENKSVIMDKKFENSLFTKMIIKRNNTTHFEILFKSDGFFVWKSV